MLALILLVFPTFGQDYVVTVTTINVWVKAIDSSGNPITGLTQQDFTVFEDGKQVEITCFEEHVPNATTTGQAGQTQPTAQEVPKQFVLFLDLFNMSSREFIGLKPRLAEFATSLIRQGHQVMLAALLPGGRMGIICPFTKDFQRIRILLNQARAGTDRELMIRKNTDELIRVIENGGDELIDRLNAGYHYALVLARQERDLTEYTLKAVQAFSEYLAKENLQDASVVYVSGGFSADPGRQYYDVVDSFAEDASTAEEMAAVATNRESNQDIMNEIDRVLGKINKMNVTFYTIDSVGLGGNRDYQDSLVLMAEETGGLSFYNSQNFKKGLDEVLTDLNHQYLLCYRAPAHAKSGQNHSIKVTSNRKDVELRHRKGYVD